MRISPVDSDNMTTTDVTIFMGKLKERLEKEKQQQS